jgi:hypothetical protein
MLNLFQTPAFAFFCYLLSIVFSSFFSSSIVSSVLPASFLSYRELGFFFKFSLNSSGVHSNSMLFMTSSSENPA